MIFKQQSKVITHAGDKKTPCKRQIAIPYAPKSNKHFSVFKCEKHLSQAAACDGTRITTSAEGQEIATGTLLIY